MIRLVVADGQDAMRAGVVSALAGDPGIEVLGEVGTGEEAVELAETLDLDLVVMDAYAATSGGVEATRRIVDMGCDVLVLTALGLAAHVRGALRAGAVGFMLKDAAPEELVNAVHLVASGKGFIDPTVVRSFVRAVSVSSPAMSPAAGLPGLGLLTWREQEVANYLSIGLSNGQIASRMQVAENTVKTHVSRILAKLGLRSRVEIALLTQELSMSA
ncbi:LuxR C-terminal-related transcriptional regulator [Streptomyces sp. NPDC057579]|uniref:LuxR C-terminal-related transcriptional regulator n=1 Tax=Streptomyces sp. NPDC057579 TaxID=3346172 RepID=UPI00367C4107